jgi:CBS domain-containing protein
MVEQRWYTLPVVENGRVVGIVGMEDLLRRLAAEA